MGHGTKLSALILLAMLTAAPAISKQITVADTQQLHAALQSLSPGDKIILAPARYRTHLLFTARHSGTQALPVRLTARDGAGSAIIDGAGADITVKFAGAAYIHLEGLDITGGGYHGVFFSDGAHHIRVAGSRIYDNFAVRPLDSHAELKGSGPADNRPHHIAILDNEIFHSSHPPGGNFQGIDCNFCDDFLISGNYLHDIRQPVSEPYSHYDRGSCIQMKSSSRNVVIERNKIAHCHIGIVYGGEGLASPEHIGGMVRNNLIYASGEIAIAVVNVHDGKILHNTLYANAGAIRVARDQRNPESRNMVLIANNILDGPVRIYSNGDNVMQQANHVLTRKETASLFINAAEYDFRLLPTATQIIDKGAMSGGQVADDFAGTLRPKGAAADIGAYEYQP